MSFKIEVADSGTDLNALAMLQFNANRNNEPFATVVRHIDPANMKAAIEDAMKRQFNTPESTTFIVVETSTKYVVLI
jgi:hypothetical protein